MFRDGRRPHSAPLNYEPGATEPAGFTLTPPPRGQHVSLKVLVLYRPRSRAFPWVENTTPSRCTTNHRYSPITPAHFEGDPGCHWFRAASQRLPPQAKPRPHSSPFNHIVMGIKGGFGKGTGPFARRYSGRRFCFRFLPLLICLSSESPPPAASAPLLRAARRSGAAATRTASLGYPAPIPHRGRGLIASCRGPPRAPSRRILRPALLN